MDGIRHVKCSCGKEFDSLCYKESLKLDNIGLNVSPLTGKVMLVRVVNILPNLKTWEYVKSDKGYSVRRVK